MEAGYMRGTQVKLAKQLAAAALIREGINPEKIPYRKYDTKTTRKVVTVLNSKGEEIQVPVDKITKVLNTACLRKQQKIAKGRLQKLLRTGFRDTRLIREHLASQSI
jgi:phage terminase large subunit-like protein